MGVAEQWMACFGSALVTFESMMRLPDRRTLQRLAVGFLPTVFLTVLLAAPVMRLMLEGGVAAVQGMLGAL